MSSNLLKGALLTTFFIVMFSGCKENTSAPDDTGNYGFENPAVAKVIRSNCATSGCHSGANAQHGLNLENYENIMAGSDARHLFDDTVGHGHGKIYSLLHSEAYGGEAVVPYFPDQSLLFRLITGNTPDISQRMPYQKNPLSSSDIETIRKWIADGCKNSAGKPYFSSAANDIFVCNQGSDTLSVIDYTTKTQKAFVPVNFNATGADAPHHVKSFGNNLFITLISAGRFTSINKSTYTVGSSVTGLQYPGMIELSKNGKTAFVSHSSTAPGSYSSIYKINTETMSLAGEITLPVAGIPHGIALSSNDSVLYVANLTKDRITVINAITGDPIGEDIVLSTGTATVHEPMHIYLTPDNSQLIVGCRKSNKILVINTSTKTVVQEIVLTDHPMQMAISSDGTKLFAVMMHEAKIVVLKKSGGTWALETGILNDAFYMLYGADLTQDGKYLIATSSNQDNIYKQRYTVPGRTRASNMVFINTTTYQVEKILDVGAFATGIAGK